MTTPLEDRVRRALAGAPAVDSSAPVEEIVRSARRRQRVLASVAVAAGAAVIAAAVATAGLLTGNTSQHPIGPGPTPSPTPTARGEHQFPLKLDLHADGAVPGADGRSVWVAHTEPGPAVRYFVGARRSRLGALQHTVHVPAPVDQLRSGAGEIWALGGGDGGYPNGVLTAISPKAGTSSLRFHGSGPYDIAFVDGQVFVTLPAANRVVSVGVRGGRLVELSSVRLPGQVTDIVATDDGTVWAREDLKGQVVEIRSGPAGLSTGRTFDWKYGLLGPGPDGTIWTSDGYRLVSLDPGLAAKGEFSLAEGYRISVPGPPTAVTADAAGGLYVGVDGRPGARGSGSGGVLYYASADAAAAGSSPIAFVKLHTSVRDMFAYLPGGVVFRTLLDTVYRWDPTVHAR